MSGQVESLLHAIRELPDDDTPRLILADWFEDNGDPDRAEFIRIQLRLAGNLGPDERVGLKEREQELLAANLGRWAGPLAMSPWSCSYQRGTARVQIRTARLLSAPVRKLAEPWFGRALATGLRTEGTSSRWKQIFDLPLLAELSSLTLERSEINHAGLEALAASSHLSNLRSLGIQKSVSEVRGMDGPMMEALAESPYLKRLTSLSFRHYPLQQAALEILCRHDNSWPGLTALNLDWTPLSEYQVKWLLTAPWLANLRSLSVYACLPSAAEAELLVRGLAPARLRVLGLGSNRIRDDTTVLIAESAHLGELRELWLNFPEFTERGARALAESPHLGNLRLLYLYSMKREKEQAKILRERFGDVAHFEWMRSE